MMWWLDPQCHENGPELRLGWVRMMSGWLSKDRSPRDAGFQVLELAGATRRDRTGDLPQLWHAASRTGSRPVHHSKSAGPLPTFDHSPLHTRPDRSHENGAGRARIAVQDGSPDSKFGPGDCQRDCQIRVQADVALKMLFVLLKFWSHPPGSNRRPADYESAALPTELGWLSLNNLRGVGLRAQLSGQALSPRNFQITTGCRGRAGPWRPLKGGGDQDSRMAVARVNPAGLGAFWASS